MYLGPKDVSFFFTVIVIYGYITFIGPKICNRLYDRMTKHLRGDN